MREMDGMDIKEHLPIGFFETVRSTNWIERRDMLSALIDNLSHYPRIDPKIKYNEILAELKMVGNFECLILIISKDSNIVVVILALRALTAFVKGLRKNFVKYIPMVLLHVLEKFKEKKPSVKEAVVDCLSLIAEYCDTTMLSSPICEALEKATNPTVKANIDQWIYYILCQYQRSAVPITFIRSIAPYLVKHSKDSDPDVRERSCMVFGAILRLVEEKVTASIADDVFGDKTKSKKIIEYSEKAEKDFEKYRQARIGTDIALESCALSGNMECHKEAAGGLVQADTAISSWELLTETKISDKIPHDIQLKLASREWIDRKATLEMLYNILENNPRLCPDEDHSELIGILCKILEKDTNINVAAVAAKCITGFANGLRYKFAVFIPKIYVSVFEKFKEKKLILRQPLIVLCDVLALLTPLSTYIEVVRIALQKPNPQIKTQTALFLSRLLRQHNVHTLPLDCITQKLGPALTKLSFDADPDSREASFVAVGAIMRIVGENVVNDCCSEIMHDINKSTKVRQNCESLIREFGLNASASILKLHQRTCSTVVPSKVGSHKSLNADARMIFQDLNLHQLKLKRFLCDIGFGRSSNFRAELNIETFQDTKCNIKTTKKVRSVISKSKFNSIQVQETNATKNREKNSSSEKDIFFDASEEVDVLSGSSSDPDNSLGRNETYIVDERERGRQCLDFGAAQTICFSTFYWECFHVLSTSGTAITEESVPLQSVSREIKQSGTANVRIPSDRSGGSRLPTLTLRGTSGSRIPIPVYKRT
uniref:TOG domain-containing protein n=1 Tax=Wuchereria bancrofti TaxID=6293 RepID=A0A1I8EYN9_WUCBA